MPSYQERYVATRVSAAGIRSSVTNSRLAGDAVVRLWEPTNKATPSSAPPEARLRTRAVLAWRAPLKPLK